MLATTPVSARSLRPRSLALAGLAVIAAAGAELRAAPVERVWSLNTNWFRAAAIDEVLATGSPARRTVTVAQDLPGSTSALDISVWDEVGWPTDRRRWSMHNGAGMWFGLEPSCVREISTGEFLVAGTYANGGSLHWFVTIFDPITLSPVASISSSYGSVGTPTPVVADETLTGDIVVAATSFGRVRLVRLARSATSSNGFDLGSSDETFLQTAAGDPLSVNAMRVAPSGSVVIAGTRGLSLTGAAYLATIDPVTLVPIAATDYPESHLDGWFSSLWIDGSTVYAGGGVSTPAFPDFFTSARVVSVPESLNAVNWDRTYATSVLPADLRGSPASSSTDLWLAGATPNAHANGLLRLHAPTGLPVTFTRFRAGELSGLTGVAIDHSGAQPVPVAVGHWRSGPVAPNPIYGLFVRCDHNGATACSSFLPLASSPTPVTPASLQLVDVTPSGSVSAYTNWLWGEGALYQCVSIGGAPNPNCPGFTACQPPCRIDLTGDGMVNFFDLVGFVDLYLAGHPSADFDANGVLNFFDFATYVSEFQVGCP